MSEGVLKNEDFFRVDRGLRLFKVYVVWDIVLFCNLEVIDNVIMFREKCICLDI